MCVNWFLKQSCLLSSPLKHKHPHTKTLITPTHRRLATHRGQDEYLSHRPTQGRNNTPHQRMVLNCSGVEVSSWQPPSDCATVMWKAERGPLGSQRGGVEKQKWHSGSFLSRDPMDSPYWSSCKSGFGWARSRKVGGKGISSGSPVCLGGWGLLIG